MPPEVAQQTISAPRVAKTIRVPGEETGRPIVQYGWIAVAVAVVVAAIVFVIVIRMLPSYDAYGWLVWGRQAWHGNLNLNAAPSWKPLTFLFTFPYTLAGSNGALWLWMVTATAGAFAGPVFAMRIAYRIAGPAPGRQYAPIIGALFAGAAVLGIHGFWQEILSATSDPMSLALALAAIDLHMCGRRRWAWVALVLLSLGRPEAWVVTGLYALWTWRKAPSMRPLLIAGVAVIPLLWFGVAALASRSWDIASSIALQSTATYAGTAISRLWPNLKGLYELPMQLAVAFALVLTLARRHRQWLVLAGAGLTWLATDTALALHGWNPTPRYMWEGFAVLLVLAGGAIGWMLANATRPMLLRVATIAAFIALIVALVPHARIRARTTHTSIIETRNWATQIKRLPRVIDKIGGRAHILACGYPVTNIPFQSILAWELGQNVADVGYNPPAAVKAKRPTVIFTPIRAGWKLVSWEVQTYHIPAAKRAACDGLNTTFS